MAVCQGNKVRWWRPASLAVQSQLQSGWAVGHGQDGRAPSRLLISLGTRIPCCQFPTFLWDLLPCLADVCARCQHISCKTGPRMIALLEWPLPHRSTGKATFQPSQLSEPGREVTMQLHCYATWCLSGLAFWFSFVIFSLPLLTMWKERRSWEVLIAFSGSPVFLH